MSDGLVPKKEIKLCECGCGKEVKNRFISGHSVRLLWKDPNSKLNSPERSKKWSEVHNRPEVKEKHSKAMKECWKDPNSGLNSSEWRRKQSEAQKIAQNRPEVKEKQSEAIKMSWNNPNSGLNSIERSRKVSEAIKRSWQDPNSRYNSSERSRKQSKAMKRSWKEPNSGLNSPEYWGKQRIARNIKPNKPEQYLIGLFDKLSLPIRYVGDFNFWVKFENGKNRNPDFKVNKQRKVIEFHGDHWHKGEDENVLINQFKEIGYECLVIWEHELNNISEVEKKIKLFII